MSYKVAFLFGPPGVGKGTQGKILGSIPGLFHLATGDMFRGLDPASELAARVKSFSSKGDLVPDEVTIELWQEYVAKQVSEGHYNPDSDLLLLDGIPRSANQAAALDSHVDVLRIIYLCPPDIEEMVARMKRRAEQQGRADDADENVIRRRFEVYKQETAPVLKHYDRNLISEINPIGTPVEILQRVLDDLVPVYVSSFGCPITKPVAAVQRPS